MNDIVYLILILIIYISNVTIIIKLIGYELSIKSPFVALWFTLLIIILPSITDVLRSEVEPHFFANTLKLDSDLLLKSQLYMLAVLVIFSLVIMLNANRREVCYIGYENIDKNGMGIDLFFGLLGLLFIVPIVEIYNKYGLSFLASFTFAERRENISYVSKFILSYNLILFAGYATYLALCKRYMSFILILIFYCIVFVFIGGSRQPILAIIIPVFLLTTTRVNKKIPFYIIIAIVCAYFIGLLKILLYLRNLSSFDERVSALLNISDTLTQASLNASGEDNLRYVFYYFLSDTAITTDFFQFKYLMRTILFWMPSFIDIFKIKPDDFEYVMFRNVMNGEIGTMHPTLFGSIFADSGYFILPWVFLILIIRQLMLFFLHRFNGGLSVILWSIFSFSCLMIARGAIYGPIMICLYAVLMLSIIMKLTHIYNRRISIVNK